MKREDQILAIQHSLNELFETLESIATSTGYLDSLKEETEKLKNTSKIYEWGEMLHLKREICEIAECEELLIRLNKTINSLELDIAKRIPIEGLKMKVEVGNLKKLYCNSVRIICPSNKERIKLQVYMDNDIIHESGDIVTDSSFSFLDNKTEDTFDLVP